MPLLSSLLTISVFENPMPDDSKPVANSCQALLPETVSSSPSAASMDSIPVKVIESTSTDLAVLITNASLLLVPVIEPSFEPFFTISTSSNLILLAVTSSLSPDSCHSCFAAPVISSSPPRALTVLTSLKVILFA